MANTPAGSETAPATTPDLVLAETSQTSSRLENHRSTATEFTQDDIGPSGGCVADNALS